MNNRWDTYGCDKCDNYGLLVLESNNSNTKPSFQDYVNTHHVEYPAVASSEGGSDFNRGLGNSGSGNTEYFIKPDKSFVYIPFLQTDKMIQDAGIEPHECGTPIANKKSSSSPWKLSYNGTSISFEIPKTRKNTHVSLNLFNAQGRLIYTLVNETRKSGTNTVDLNRFQLPVKGVYLCRLEADNFDKTIKIIGK